MQLHVRDLVRPDPCVLVGHPQEALLRVWIGRGEPIPPTVVVDGAAADHTQDPVAARHGGVERLEDDQTAPLPSHEAICPGVEGEAAPVRRQRSERRQLEGAVRADIEVDPAGQGDARFARAQALAGHVNGDEARGLAGVDGEARSARAEEVGDAVGDHAPLGAGEGLPRDRDARVPQQSGIVA